jgi:hypothetical protein
MEENYCAGENSQRFEASIQEERNRNQHCEGKGMTKTYFNRRVGKGTQKGGKYMKRIKKKKQTKKKDVIDANER